MGRLPAVTGGGPTVPETEQAGKAAGPTGIAGLPKTNLTGTGLPWLHNKDNPVF